MLFRVVTLLYMKFSSSWQIEHTSTSENKDPTFLMRLESRDYIIASLMFHYRMLTENKRSTTWSKITLFLSEESLTSNGWDENFCFLCAHYLFFVMNSIFSLTIFFGANEFYRPRVAARTFIYKGRAYIEKQSQKNDKNHECSTIILAP